MHDAIVIGAGPAGLATSRELQQRGIEHVVLERETAGASWSRLYDSLTLHTGKHLSHLPGLHHARGAPMFLPRAAFLEYLHDYRQRFALPIEEHAGVRSVRRERDRWIVDGRETRAVVVATGIISNPRVPRFRDQEKFPGVIRHSVTYRNPGELRGKRVLVVGAGNSAGEIASELGRAGVETTIAIRSGANVVPLQIAGIPIQYIAYMTRNLPRAARNALVGAMRLITPPPVLPRPAHGPLDSIPMIGFNLVNAIRNGSVQLRGGVESFTSDGVRFSDGTVESFDEVLLATGFASSLPFLGDQVAVDAKGFARRSDRVTSAEQPDLYFVGLNYDTTGALTNIRRDAALVAAALERRAGVPPAGAGHPARLPNHRG